MIFCCCNFIYFYQKNSNRVDNVYFVFKFVNVNLKRCLRFRMDSGYHFNISRYFTPNFIIFKIYCSNLTSMLIFFLLTIKVLRCFYGFFSPIVVIGRNFVSFLKVTFVHVQNFSFLL